jgi:hypothetical protein
MIAETQDSPQHTKTTAGFLLFTLVVLLLTGCLAYPGWQWQFVNDSLHQGQPLEGPAGLTWRQDGLRPMQLCSAHRVERRRQRLPQLDSLSYRTLRNRGCTNAAFGRCPGYGNNDMRVHPLLLNPRPHPEYLTIGAILGHGICPQ